jgi:amino-acid N-acetyltransferase
MIRRALIRDIVGIAQLVNQFAERGLMLHRSMEHLYEHARDFHVALDDEENVVGVCGLNIVWADLAEVYSLAVDRSQQGKGLGSRLVEAAIDDAQELGIRQLMSLTYEQRFFERLGFIVVDRMTLPLKVWSECMYCPKKQACDEIAMVRVLDVPKVEAPKPGRPVGSLIELPILADDMDHPDVKS